MENQVINWTYKFSLYFMLFNFLWQKQEASDEKTTQGEGIYSK